MVHPPIFRGTRGLLYSLEAKGGHSRRLVKTGKLRPLTQEEKCTFENKSEDPDTPRHLPINSDEHERNQAAVDSILPHLSDRNQTESAKSNLRQTLNPRKRHSDRTKASPEKMQGPPSSPEIICCQSGVVAATTSKHPRSILDLDNKQNVDQDTNLSGLYTTASRFRSPPPTPMPSWPPERKGVARIAAGKIFHLDFALLHSLPIVVP